MARKLIECIGLLCLIACVFVTALGWADRAMGATANGSRPSPFMLDASTLAYVHCGSSVGTAVYLGGGEYLTAAHVVYGNDGACEISGEVIRILHANVDADWALLSAKNYPPFHAVISCARLVEGQQYFSTGYAEGMPWPVTTRLIAESSRHDGESYLRGNLINGMSGGPVSDQDGVLHAINDTRAGDGIPNSGVVEIADIPWLCPKGQ